MAKPDETDGLKEFGDALAQLTPSQTRVDRDGLLFAAGRVDGMRSTRSWKFTALAATSAAILLTAWMFIRGPRVEERIVIVNVPAAATPAEKFSSDDSASNYLPLESQDFTVDRSNREQLESRWRVLRFGPESLPDHAAQVSADVPPVRNAEEDRGIFQGFSDKRLNLMLPR